MSSKKKIIIICVAVVVLLAIAACVFFFLNSSKTFTVTYNTDGGSQIEPAKVKEGALVQLPKDPTKEGYIFLYWADENGAAVLENFKATKNITLIATWAEEGAEIVTVTFDTDGGSQIKNLEVIKGEKVILPDNPTKDGYTFKKWIYNGKEFDSNMAIEEDITIKAEWEKKEEEKKEEKKEEPKKEEQVDATGITLNTSSVDLIIGNSGSLTATVTPDNAKDKSVTWSSSDSSIISVDGSGNLKANKIGEATITAKTSNGKTATAKVYSDVESITLSGPNNRYISKYNGATSSVTLTVTTNPSVDSSLIKWSAPDATGANAAASFSGSGTKATITARDAWGSTASQIPVTVSVGRKTSNKLTVYVEPSLSTSFVSGSTIVNRNEKVEIRSNITVNSWTFNSENFATNIKKTDRDVSFISKNDRTHQEGFVITVKSLAGQSKSISISVNAK